MKEFKLTPQTSYLVGLICGDGTIYRKPNKEYTIAITDKNEEFHRKILKPLIEENLSLPATIKSIKGRNAWSTVVRSKEFLEVLTNSLGLSVGKRKTYRDSIPNEILRSDRETILSHIGGWIDAEGSSKIKTFRTKYGIYKYPCITIELVNKKFLNGIYILSKSANNSCTKPILLKRNYRKDQKIRFGVSWNGVRKCLLLLDYMKHPQKKRNLKDKILVAGGRPV